MGARKGRDGGGFEGVGGVRAAQSSDDEVGGRMAGDDTSASSIVVVGKRHVRGDEMSERKQKRNGLCMRERECVVIVKCWVGIKDAQVRYGTWRSMDAGTDRRNGI